MLCCKIIKSPNNLKLKVRTEFPNVWREYKYHSNPYIQVTTVPCDNGCLRAFGYTAAHEPCLRVQVCSSVSVSASQRVLSLQCFVIHQIITYSSTLHGTEHLDTLQLR